MRGAVPISLATLLVALSATSIARAFERQWHLGGGLGVAAVPGSDYPAGPLVGAHLAYGVSDMFDARLELGLSRHVLDATPAQTQWLYGADAGFVYKIDVIEWVPYLGLLAGLHGASEEPRAKASDGAAPFHRYEADVAMVLGVDYAFARSFALGVELRYHAVVRHPTETGYSVAMLHAEYRWGW